MYSQIALPLRHELIIDNFAGGGGTSTGLEAAFGRPVDIAINHDPEALAMHALNHPYTHHLCESVWDVDPIKVTQNQPVALVWLSPDCKHFSKAKGGTPVSKHIRGLAWVGLRWVALTKPRVLMLENVEEFQTWGPVVVDPDGYARPDPARKGKTFESFVRQLRQHGYQVDWKELRACDQGAPTIRKRLFLVARRDGLPIMWPKQTHGAPTSREVLAGMLAPHRTAAECIDFSLPAQSIFGRKKALATNTQRRVAKGLFRHVLNTTKPFIVANTSGHSGASTEQPLPTITTGNHHYVAQPVVAPYITEHANASQQRTMAADSPLRTICAQTKGGAFSVVAAAMAPLRGTSQRHMSGHSVAQPLSTVSAQGTHHALIGANLVTASGSPSSLLAAFFEQANAGFFDGTGRSAQSPMSTITSSGANQQLVTAYLVKYYSSGGQWQAADEPMHTLPTKARMGLVQTIQVPAGLLTQEQHESAQRCAAFLHQQLPEQFTEPAELVLMNHEEAWWVLVDITLRMLVARELYRAQSFPDTYLIDEIPDPKLLFKNGAQVPGDPRDIPRIKLSKTAQVRMCGNSVAPAQAQALIKANFRHEEQFMAKSA